VTGGEHEGERFEGETVEGLEDVRFEGCELVGCTLANATLRDCRFTDCRFLGCDLTMAKVPETSFREVVFERCKLMGVDFAEAHGLTFDARFEECVLRYAGFAGMKLEGLVATGDLREAIFTDADLRKARLAGNLEGVDLRGADLREADLRAAEELALDPREVRLKKTVLPLDAILRVAALLGIEAP